MGFGRMKANWKKGLLRAWSVFSIVWWVVGFGVIIQLAMDREFYKEKIYGFNDNGVPIYYFEFQYWWLICSIILLIGVPFLMTAFWKVIKWIIKGFNED